MGLGSKERPDAVSPRKYELRFRRVTVADQRYTRIPISFKNGATLGEADELVTPRGRGVSIIGIPRPSVIWRPGVHHRLYGKFSSWYFEEEWDWPVRIKMVRGVDYGQRIVYERKPPSYIT